ncbi:SDR family oxidoreductase [Elongatibacter sediminis]|uniref:SDR family oxidoreductase n=1 Tax=Elongatibacter sediminis TaxID=3119006 RepID=A0AAW9RGH2_9GAMM
MTNLKQKVAIITGSAASIGESIARHFHECGAAVVIADCNAEGGAALARDLGERAVFVETDITDDSALDALVEAAVERFGSLDILVNNACSYGDDGPQTDRDTWLGTLNTNVVSAALLGEKARPHLKKAGGCIVNIGSISGVAPHIHRWAYPVSKAALIHLTRTQAVEYADDGIRVNLLRLGHIWSAPFAGLTGDDRAHADKVVTPYNLKGRVADGKEVAQVAAFAASEEASYVTGAEIPVDGGYTTLGPERRDPLMALLSREA